MTKKLTESHKNKIRKSMLRKNLGKKLSKEHKEKLRRAKLGKLRTDGKSVSSNGYIRVYMPNHPHAHNKMYVLEHRLIMEMYIGRYLSASEEIHHVNNIRTDNRIENLKIVTKSEHAKIHNPKLTRWSKNYSECQHCFTTEFYYFGRGYCSRCYRFATGRTKSLRALHLKQH